MGPHTDVDARSASCIYIKTAFLNSSQNHGPYPNTGIICLCLCYIDHVFSRFYFSLCDGNTRVCTRFSLFTPYRTCIKDMQAILPQLQHGLYPVTFFCLMYPILYPIWGTWGTYIKSTPLWGTWNVMLLHHTFFP